MQRFALGALTIMLSAVFSAGADLAAAKAAYKKRDYATAFKQLTPLVKRGNAAAEVLLGRMYLMGYGVLKEPDEAYKLFRAAAAQGDADAEFMLGSQAVFLHIDVANGLSMLRLSAEQGNRDAQLLLGKTYMQGFRPYVPRDPVQADMWLRLAARHNLPFYRNELRIAERQMNAAEIAKGKALAAAWKPKRGLRPPASGKPGARPAH